MFWLMILETHYSKLFQNKIWVIQGRAIRETREHKSILNILEVSFAFP